MQSKLSELKRKFVQLVAIKKLSGVGWNAETCLPVVPPDFIKNYCTGSKKRLSVMFTKKLDNFYLLQEIYEGKVFMMIPALLKMPMTTRVQGWRLLLYLDYWMILLIHTSSNGKMRKAPQIAELKPDPKQKKRGNFYCFLVVIYIIINNCH